MAQNKEKQKAKHQAIAEMFAAVAGERFSFVVNRDGNARQRDMLVNGNIRLSWTSTGNSVPIDLPAGTYTVQGIIFGTLVIAGTSPSCLQKLKRCGATTLPILVQTPFLRR